jgi:hypothetical protein
MELKIINQVFYLKLPKSAGEPESKRGMNPGKLLSYVMQIITVLAST